jgi:hypothetical protein
MNNNNNKGGNMDYRGRTYHKTNFYGVRLVEQGGDWYIEVSGNEDVWYGTKRPTNDDIKYFLQMYE